MKTRDFLEGVVDYIEVSQEAIAVLRKKAAEAEAKPAFSDDALTQTAEKLVKADVLSKEAADHLVQSFRENPDKALHSLQRCADELMRRSSERVTTLGGAAPLSKKAAKRSSSNAESEADRAWEEAWLSSQ